jgi:defect-in-organelle-trafficking protein DotA
MNKIWTFIWMLCLPNLVFAGDGSLTFTPPPTDYSVIFLGDIFGIVDGVLHGTGSQIMGEMFGVFNAAVLALGGIVVMYTLIVGTMNTAQEGQMLGQKWSSIWIPVRSTIGLAFLIPKSSGYCLMQVFIMWVCVQGVGAADKIWNAALDYLNRGGAIVKAQQNMNSSTSSENAAIVDIATGAQIILSGEVCMRGLQKILETQRTALLKRAESDSGDCSKTQLQGKNSSDPMVYFCQNPVPDFISTVNLIQDAKLDTSTNIWSITMPNFKDKPYVDLNGTCGKIGWADFNPDLSGKTTLSAEDVETTKQSRVTALQQMYSDFTSVASEMIDNDPEITPTTDTNKYSDVAINQFGVPLLDSGVVCSGASSKCVSWGTDQSGANSTLSFTGFEFQNAIMDYNGIMLPALNLQNSDTKQSNKLKDFIATSEEQGWIMAGSYFFNVVYLNGMVTENSNTVDGTAKLADSCDFDIDYFLTDPFQTCSSSTLCTFLKGDKTGVTNLAELMDGRFLSGGSISASVNNEATAKTNQYSSTTFGFITNGSLVHLPGQPGLDTPKFKMNFNIQAGTTLLSFPKKSFSCRLKALFCLDSKILDGIYNNIFRGIVNVFISFIVSTFNLMLQTFLYVPLDQLMVVFNNGVQLLETTMVHPIIALAYMGSAFINASVDIWLNLIAFSAVLGMLTPLVLIAVFLILPFLASWMGVMVSVGWIDAYYVPFIPYMIFTFGSIAWLMAVTEAMVAGPIVALGVSHPEGHDALGKAEQAVMILINVFLRPAMMIIGYIASIALSYVAVFILNSGFVNVMKFLMPETADDGFSGGINYSQGNTSNQAGAGQASPYYNWSAIYASFFCLVTYTSLYLTVVQKSFSLIHNIPDKILRYMGSQGESFGQETAQWAEDTRGQVKEAGQETGKGSMKTGGTVMSVAEGAIGAASKSGGGDVAKSG